MKKLLITGSNGFVGNYFMSHLQIAINNPQFKLNQIQKKPFEIV